MVNYLGAIALLEGRASAFGGGEVREPEECAQKKTYGKRRKRLFTTLAFRRRCKVDQSTVWTFDAAHGCRSPVGWRLDVRTEEGRFGPRVGTGRNYYVDLVGTCGKFFNKVLTSWPR